MRAPVLRPTRARALVASSTLLAAAVLAFGPISEARAARNGAELFPTGTFFTVGTDNVLRHGLLSAPGEMLGAVDISGLQGPETILGIDFRPSSGQLYGLGSTSRL